MMTLQNLRVRTRLLLLIAAPLLSMVAMGLVSYRVVSHIGVGGEVQTHLAQDAELNADILPPPLFLVETFLAVHSLADSDAARAPELIEEIRGHAKLFEERAEHWGNGLLEGESRRAIMDRVIPTGRAFFAAVQDEVVPLAMNGGGNAAREVVDKRIEGLFAAHKAAVLEAVTVVNESTKARIAAARAAVWSSGVAMVVAFALGVCLSVVFGLVIARGVLGPLASLTRFMEDLASGSGDLRKKMPGSEANTELGRLAAAFNAFAAKLSGLVRDIDVNAREVAGSAQQIAAAMEESERSVEGQSTSLSEISRDVDALVTESTTVAAQAQQAADSATQTREVATQGGQTVERTIKGMKAIEEAVGAGAQDVAELGKKSEEIGRIIQVINDIADQTNLLALNAAIEAARAGEHGRGFAVVADEVRKLAERTTGATKQVAESIRCIQEQTGHAVERMQAGTERVREGVSLAGDASAALNEIVNRVVSTTDLIESISVAVKNNNKIGEQIRGRCESITASAREMGEAASASAKATGDLQGRSRSLLEMIGRFQVDQGTGGTGR